MAKAIGIDLGTTNSVGAVIEMAGEEPTIITLAEGGRLCQSVVGFGEGGERLVGVMAKRQAVLRPQHTVNSVKRLMGRRFDEVEEERKIAAYTVSEGKNGAAVVEIDGKQYTPEQISSMILEKIKADAEAFLGEEVNDAVITCPAYFNDSQRQSTKLAGEIAGLNVLRVINEPTAATLAYGADKETSETILVWDLGGGTFDVTVLDMGDGVFEVKSTNGDTHLGGDNWDEMLVNKLADDFRIDTGIDLREDPQALQRLREGAEKAKVELSTVLTTDISLPFITVGPTGPQHLNTTVTRAQFEELTRPLLDRQIEPFHSAIKDAELKVENIDEVVLVGGSSRMPAVQALVKELTGKEPNKTVNPDEVVAAGAAIQAAILTGEGGGKDIVLVDVTPLSLGVETAGGVMTVMIERNTAIPTEASEIYTTAKDYQPEVEVHVLQGERPMARDNRSLGRFQLSGIPPAPRGTPQVEVQFTIDANGILNVAAKERTTGQEQTVTIAGSTGLSKQDVDRIVSDAESHADDDKRRQEIIQARHSAMTLAGQADRLIEEHGARIPEDEQTRVKGLIAKVRSLEASEDLEAVQSAESELAEAYRGIGDTIYQQAQAEAAPPEAEGEPVDEEPTEEETE